jgi:outer membrane protein assembly factor BamD
MTTSAKWLALSLMLCAACAGGKESVDISKPVTGAEASNAEKAYKRGLQEKQEKNFLEAVRYLEYVRNNFPYSQYAALAELAIADMAFEREDWSTAASQYVEFVKSHPSHPKADYAAFRAGLARWEDKPADLWFLPPSYEKDQGPLRSALEALQRFVITYPKSEYVPKARELIADTRERLAKHEQFVADFYWKRKAWKGAAGRLLVLADKFGDLQGGRLRAEALWRASEAYRNLNDPADERRVLQRLVQEAPGSEQARNATARLRQLPSDGRTAAPAEQKPPTQAAPSGPPVQTTTPEPTSNEPRPSPTPTEPQPAKPSGPPR